MSKYPRGMTKRGGCYYLRLRRGGREEWLRLGSDFDGAKDRCRKLRGITSRPEQRVRVEEFSKRWLEERVASRQNEKGQRLAAQRLRDHILPVLGRKLMAEVTTADLRGVLLALKPKGLAANTEHHILSDVRSLFKYAAEEVGMLDRSPWRKSLMPPIQAPLPQPLAESELAQVLEICPQDRKPLVQIAAHTGLRYGELRALRWEDVKLGAQPHLIVRRSHMGPTKGRKVRMVPLSEEAEAILEAMDRVLEYVFTGRKGGMMGGDASSLSDVIKRSVPGFHFHRLRHTFATRFLNAGGSRDDLQEILGHSCERLSRGYGRRSDPVLSQNLRSLDLKLPKTGDKAGEAPLLKVVGLGDKA